MNQSREFAKHPGECLKLELCEHWRYGLLRQFSMRVGMASEMCFCLEEQMLAQKETEGCPEYREPELTNLSVRTRT